MKKRILFVVLITFGVSQSGWAEEVPAEKTNEIKRASQVRLSVDSGRDEFRASEFSAKLGLDPMWRIEAGIGGEKSQRIQTATSYFLGADLSPSSDFSFNLSLQSRREPDTVVARGISTGLNWVVSSLWNALLHTELSLQGVFLKYKQDEGSRTRVRDGGISQNSLSLLLSQELSESFEVHTSYTGYGFGGATSEELSNAIGNRPNVNPDFLSVITGFPKRSYSLGASAQASDRVRVGLDFFKTDSFSSSSSKGLSLSTDWDLSADWTLGVGVSSTKSDVGNSSGLFSLSIAYRW